MTREEFTALFSKLHDAFPATRISGSAEATWFESLERFNFHKVRAAFSLLVAESKRFPNLGDVKELCRENGDARRRYPRQRYFEIEHDCNLDGKRIEMSDARLLLFRVAPYEAVHVKCETFTAPVCAWCGSQQKPFVNPFIRELIERFPGETSGWIPTHKGTVLCGACESLPEMKVFETYRGDHVRSLW